MIGVFTRVKIKFFISKESSRCLPFKNLFASRQSSSKAYPNLGSSASQTLSGVPVQKVKLTTDSSCKLAKQLPDGSAAFDHLDPISQQRVPVTQNQVEEAFYGCSCDNTAPNNKGEQVFKRDKGQKEGNTWTFH